MQHLRNTLARPAREPAMTRLKLSFYIIVTSQAISMIGSTVLRFTISLHVLDLTGSAEIFATMVAVSFLPLIIFQPIGGALADRFSKKMLLVISDSANTLLVGGLAVLLFGGSESVLLLGAAITLLVLISTCYFPTVAASLPALLGPDELPKANGIVQGIRAMATIASPVLAGFLFGAIGVTNLVALCVVIYLISALLNVFIKIPHKPQKAEGGALNAIAGDLKSGMLYITKENTMLLTLAVIVAVINFFYQALLSVTFPFMIRVYLGMSEQLFGFANAAIGASILIGSFAAGRLKRYMHMRYMPRFFVIQAAATVPIAMAMLASWAGALAPYLLLTFGFMVIMFTFTLINILAMTHMQTHVPPQMIGKVIGLVSSIVSLPAPAGQFAMGLVIEHLGQAQFVLYLSIVAIVLALSLVAKKRLAA